MTRKTTGFISKRPHKKSRAGCGTCKRKKVKCDEVQPICGYCSHRKLECTFISTEKSPAPNSSIQRSDSSTSGSQTPEIEDFNTIEIPAWIIPPANTSSGQLNSVELALLHQFKTEAWTTVTVREAEPVISYIMREWIPQASVSHSYLLHSILTIAASHSNNVSPAPEKRFLIDTYRQKAISSYKENLKTITHENYETLLVTAMYMQTMLPVPEFPCTDDDILSYLYMFLNLTHGIRLLASLKWALGIEKLSVFPLFVRELRKLPPPPDVSDLQNPSLYSNDKGVGDSPIYPNPPAMYSTDSTPPSPTMDMSKLAFRPLKLMSATPPSMPESWKARPMWQIPAPAFLPPPLMAVLKSIVESRDTGIIDIHRSTLVPVLHAFSPIFLSLYYYHICPDFFVRVSVLPTLFPKEFLVLVRNGEPRALLMIAWWMAFMRMVPKVRWMAQAAPRVFQAVSNMIMRSNNSTLMDGIEGAYKIVRMVEARGLEVAAKSIFDDWEGLTWESGPILADGYAQAPNEFPRSKTPG